MRVAVLDMLHGQQRRRRVMVSVPLAEAPALAALVRARRPWWRRAWAWLVDRYHLVGWQGD